MQGRAAASAAGLQRYPPDSAAFQPPLPYPMVLHCAHSLLAQCCRAPSHASALGIVAHRIAPPPAYRPFFSQVVGLVGAIIYW